MMYYWLTFNYEGEEERTHFIEGVKDLKEEIALLKSRGAYIIKVVNGEFKDLTKRYDK